MSELATALDNDSLEPRRTAWVSDQPFTDGYPTDVASLRGCAGTTFRRLTILDALRDLALACTAFED